MSITAQSLRSPQHSPESLSADSARDEADKGQTIPSEALLRGLSCVAIDHEGMRYVLRATRAGKLILTK